MSADETMAEVMAGVAIAEARRTGLLQVVEHTGAAWHLYSQGAVPLCGEGTLVVVRPREDVVGVAKRILGARLSGLTVPQAVLALVARQAGAETRAADESGDRRERVPSEAPARTGAGSEAETRSDAAPVETAGHDSNRDVLSAYKHPGPRGAEPGFASSERNRERCRTGAGCEGSRRNRQRLAATSRGPCCCRFHLIASAEPHA